MTKAEYDKLKDIEQYAKNALQSRSYHSVPNNNRLNDYYDSKHKVKAKRGCSRCFLDLVLPFIVNEFLQYESKPRKSGGKKKSKV